MFRSVAAPQNALGHMLRRLTQRLEDVEHRTRWSGATQFAEELGVITFNDNVWTEVLSIDLDPGRWMLYATANIGSFDAYKLLEVRLPGTNSVPSSTTTVFVGFGPGSVALSVVGSVLLTTANSVSLEARSTDTGDSGQVTSAFIIAVPV